MFKTKTMLYSGFFTVLTLMGVLTVSSLNVLNASMDRLDIVVNKNNLKTEILHNMRAHARERNVSLLKMVSILDESELEYEWDKFRSMGGLFAEARSTLLSMNLSKDERDILNRQGQLTQIVAPLQNRIAEMIIFDEIDQAEVLIHDRALPMQDQIFLLLTEFLEIQKKTADQAVKEASRDYQTVMLVMSLIACIVFLVSLYITLYVTRSISRTEVDLLYHRDNLEKLVKDRTQELEKALHLAEQANIAKTEFLSMVSHELRTPLTSIRGSLGLIEGEVASKVPSKMKGLLGIACSNTERLLALIDDILDVQKIESGLVTLHSVDVDIRALFREATKNLTTYANKKNITFNIICNEDVHFVKADENQLMRVLNNLISNAIKFSPMNGSIDIRAVNSDNKLRMSVTDHGPGIPEEFQSKVFEKFTQADTSDSRRYSGSGLGLNIAKKIIDLHEGKIWFESDQGSGTTFYVELSGCA